MLKRMISLFLCVVLAASMIPAPVYAQEESTQPTQETMLAAFDAEEPIGETTAPTEETILPAEEVTEPTGETTSPTEEMTQPTEETASPTEEVTQPTEETASPTEEVTQPTEETTSSTEDATEPTEEPCDAPTNGICGESLTWTWEDGVLSIAGTGPMDSFDRETGSPWYPLREEILAAEIGDGITTIGGNAFFGCTAMKSIRIPATVTAISATAFDDCHQLEAVQYDGSLEQWNGMTDGRLAEYVFPAVSGFGLRALSAEDQTPDVGVSEDFLLPVDQITDVEDIPEGFTAIYDEEGLRAIAEDMSGKYILMKDIHVEGGHWPGLWSLNGSFDGSFRGELEGNGHTISGLYYQEWNSSDVRFGLFEEIDGAKISNLKVVGGYNNTQIGSVNDYVLLGGLAGDATGNIQINNCVSDMEFTSITTSAYTVIYTGGIIGRYKGTTDTASINSCRNIADIAAMENSGGIVGFCSLTSSELTIYNCRNDANITFSKKVVGNDNSNTAGAFGGIAGYISGSNSQTVISLCMNKGNINVGQAGGGIAGCAYCGPDMTVASCVNTGNVNGRNIGGIVGRASEEGIIQDCLNTGAITMGNSIDDAGGIAGDGGKYYRCVNVGKVKGDSWGFNSAIVHQPGSTFSTEDEAAAAVVDCYWLDDGQTNTLYTMASYNPSETPRTIRTRGRLTLEELAKKESFTGFDFTNVWMMNPMLGHPVPVGIRLPMNMEIEEVGDNQAITLNHSGDTYAYFKSKPDFMYIYTLEGFPNSAGTAQAQADGLIRVHLGHYREHGTFEGKITFTAVSTVDSIDVIELDRPKTFDIKVTVTPLEFSQKYAVSLGVDGGFSLGAGAKLELDVPALGTFGVEATLGKLQGSTGTGTALNISRSYSGDRSTLEITSEEADRAKVGVKSGIDGTILKADVDILTAGTESELSNTGIYGFRIEDYSPDNKAQRNAIGVYVLNEAMKSRPNQLAFKDFLNTQSGTVYKEANLDLISGTGAAVSTSFNGGIGSIEIGNVPVVTVYDKEANASISVEQSHYSDGDKKYTTAFAADETYSTLSNSLIDGKIAQDYYGREITMEAQSANGEKALETTSLSVDAKTIDSFTVGTEYTTDYNRYRFTEKSLSELTASSAGIRSYFAGNQYAIGGEEFKAVGKLLSYGENPVEYSNVEKKQLVSNHELGFDGQLIVGVELGLSFSYMQEHEHTNAGGFVVDDRKLETSRSDDLTDAISEKSFNLSNVIRESVNSLRQKIADFFTQVTGTIKDGAQTLWNWVTGNSDSQVEGIITLCTPAGTEPWMNSHTLEISGTDGELAATLGRPVIIQIQNEETGEEITDLSETPLTFTIRYAAEELAIFGGQDQMPAMYRCSDDGKYLEFIGGTHDQNAGTVTAVIDKPGQYTLAVAAEEENSGSVITNRVAVFADELNGQTSVWIDGEEYKAKSSGNIRYVDLPHGNAKTMIVYNYHVGDASDVHTQYPVSMKVWTLENQDGFYTTTRVEVLDDILQYSGSSIRVTGQKGIRMITSMERTKKNALVSDGLAGYTLKEYGTVVAWAGRIKDNPLVLGKSYAKSNYAYKKGVADPVFAYEGDLMQYTNVLVGFSDIQCKKDLAMRPYMILEDAAGNEITLYGGIVTRSIGYIAYQNRNAFTAGTEAYKYVWDIIHSVYDDTYDEI